MIDTSEIVCETFTPAIQDKELVHLDLRELAGLDSRLEPDREKTHILILKNVGMKKLISQR